jgi:Ca2+-binding RTX toxin-like protein
VKKLLISAALLSLLSLPAIGMASETSPNTTTSCFGKKPTIVGNATATVVGTNGPDVIARGAIINGLGGDDLICGLKGADHIYGGSGSDKIDGGDQQDTIDGGPGNDLITNQGFVARYADCAGGETVSYATASGPVNVNLATGRATGAAGTDTLVNVNEVRGSRYGDTIRGGNSAVLGSGVFAGGKGNDTIFGSSGIPDTSDGDLLVGGDGADKLTSTAPSSEPGWPNTLLRGGGGSDTLAGGPGSDTALYSATITATNAWACDTRFPGARAAITANTSTGVATGEGTDTLINIDGLIGSEFDDNLNIRDGRSSGQFHRNGVAGEEGDDRCVADANDRVYDSCETVVP